jgi:hypothetical protein
MARPQKATVDYFPHDVSHGKTMFILESKWGNDGYAVWFKILERLGASDNHVLDVSDPAEFTYLAAYCRVPEETLEEIINECSALNAIDRDFWRKKLVYSQNFVNRVRDAYRKRTKKLISNEEIRSQYLGFPAEETLNPAEETPQNDISGVSNPQREIKGKLKEKKESKKKKTLTPLPEKFSISERVEKWADGKGYFNLEAHLESFISKCRAKDYRYADWDDAFMTAIREDWAKLRTNGNGNRASPQPVTHPKVIENSRCPVCGKTVLQIDLTANGCIYCEFGRKEAVN